MRTPTPEIRQCFDSQLQSLLPALNLSDGDVMWENARGRADPKRLYLAPFFLLQPSEAASIGQDGFERLSGIYQVSVFAPRGQGPKQYEAVARDIVDHFRGGQTLSCCEDVEIVITTAYTGSAIFESDRVMCPVSVVWHCYIQKG